MGEISITLLKPNNKLAGFIAAMLLFILGGVIAVPSAIAFAKVTQSLHWPSVDGVILSAATHTPGEGPDYLTVKYEYKYNGTTYQGNRICFGMDTIGAKRLGPVHAGENIAVFVNPQIPQECVLTPGIDGGTKVFLGIGCGLVILGLIVCGASVQGCVRT